MVPHVLGLILSLSTCVGIILALAGPAPQSDDPQRCATDRLLVAGSEAANAPSALWWVRADANTVRQIDGSDDQRSFLVAVSPDHQWVMYYQRSPLATDKFIVDTWVMDLSTDERYKLVDGNAPIAWAADSAAVVLGERPYVMARVPSGELVPTSGELVSANALRTALSPDGLLQASVATTPNGAAGITISDAGTHELVMDIPTGRGAVQLAWSPDSSRLAFTSATDGPDGLVWRLRLVDLAPQRVTLLDSTAGMELHSVVWAPPLPGCP